MSRPDRVRFADNGHLRLAYQIDRLGLRHRGRPLLLMIQGLGFDRTGWQPVLEPLRKHFRLLLMDNRGCGDSDVSDRPFGVRDLARDAVCVLDAAGVDRAHVLGVSLGGMAAQEVAIGYPERVQHLVLCCTTPGWPSGFPMPARSVRLMAGLRHLPLETAIRRQVENALSAQTVRSDPVLVERLVEHHLAHPGDRAGWRALNAAGARYIGGSRHARIRARTLVLHGSADTVVDPRNGVLLGQRIPRAEVIILPGLGHLFFWERPATLTEPVIRFLSPCG